MAYIKHNYQSGEKLYAAQLNEMDDQIAKNESDVERLSEEIEALKENGSTGESEVVSVEITQADIVDGAFIGGNPAYASYGKEAPTETYVCTRMLPVDFDADKPLTVRCTIYGNASLAFYDVGGNVLRVISGNSAPEYGLTAVDGMSTYVVIPPDGAKYIRMSGQKTAGGSGAVYTQPSDFVLMGEKTSGGTDKTAVLEEKFTSNITDIASKKVLVIGDSISADYYADYPKWVTHLTDIGFFGLDNITNDSVHATGFVARYNDEANDFITRLAAVTDPESYDMVIIFGGINDYIKDIPMGESGGDKLTSFKPAVDDFFATLTERFVGARIAVLTPLRTRYYNNANAAGHKQPDYAEYIKSVAQKYALPVLDLMNHSGFHPEHDYFRQRWTFKNWSGGDGTQGDGTHPIEEYERKYLAPMIRHFLQGLL